MKAADQISLISRFYLDVLIRTFLVRCSARVTLQDARDVDRVDLCHRGVGHGCRHDVDRGCRDGRSHGVDLCLRVAYAQAQHIPQASRGGPCVKVSSCLS